MKAYGRSLGSFFAFLEDGGRARIQDIGPLGAVLEHNPALSVKAPRQKLGKGKTPVLTAEEAGELLRSIETATVVGLRDRALIGVIDVADRLFYRQGIRFIGVDTVAAEIGISKRT